MKKIRINNIECRKNASPRSDKFSYEIVKWEPNSYYGKEEELIKEGYEWSIGGDFLQKDAHSIDRIMFYSKEFCYVIAWLNIDNEGVPYIKTVGDRLLDLNGAELYSFMEVYRRADEKLKQKNSLINLMNSENDNAVTMTNGVEIDVVAEVNTDYGDFVITVDDNCYLILKRLENGKYEPKQYIEKEFHNALKELPSLSEKTFENKHLDVNPYSTKISKRVKK